MGKGTQREKTEPEKLLKDQGDAEKGAKPGNQLSINALGKSWGVSLSHRERTKLSKEGGGDKRYLGSDPWKIAA